jgi:hypothetical protein
MILLIVLLVVVAVGFAWVLCRAEAMADQAEEER